MKRFYTAFMSNIELNELYSNVNRVEQHTESFLATKHSDSLKEYLRNINEPERKQAGSPMTLGDEIKNIKTYIYILKSRFADRIEYSQDIDESVLSITSSPGAGTCVVIRIPV